MNGSGSALEDGLEDEENFGRELLALGFDMSDLEGVFGVLGEDIVQGWSM